MDLKKKIFYIILFKIFIKSFSLKNEQTISSKNFTEDLHKNFERYIKEDIIKLSSENLLEKLCCIFCEEFLKKWDINIRLILIIQNNLDWIFGRNFNHTNKSNDGVFVSKWPPIKLMAKYLIL